MKVVLGVIGTLGMLSQGCSPMEGIQNGAVRDAKLAVSTQTKNSTRAFLNISSTCFEILKSIEYLYVVE